MHLSVGPIPPSRPPPAGCAFRAPGFNAAEPKPSPRSELSACGPVFGSITIYPPSDTYCDPPRRCAAPSHSRRRTSPLVGALPVHQLPAAAAAMVTARASGHCEILAPACLLVQHLIFTRRPQGAPLPPDSPASALAACANCAELIEHTDAATAARYGYITNTRQPITSWPVYWRQRRWVTLGHFGELIELPSQPATSSDLRRPA